MALRTSLSRVARASALTALTTAGLRVGLGCVLVFGALHFTGSTSALVVGQKGTLAAALMHWDATWYHWTALSGYPATAPERTAFFPLYPLVVRGLTELGLTYSVAALGISWAGLAGATWAVVDLARRLFPETPAYRAAVLFTWFPVSVFLTAGYAESLYLALAGWCLSMIARGSFGPAAVLSGLASAARPEGVLLATALVVALLQRRQPLRAVIAGIVGSSGLIAFSAFCWVRFGQPLEYLEAQGHWGRRTNFPFVVSGRALYEVLRGHIPVVSYATELVVEALLMFALLAGLVWFAQLALTRRVELWPYLPFLTGCLVIAASNGRFGTLPDGSGRIVMVMTPVIMLVATLRWWWIPAIVCIGSASVLEWFFASGHVVV